MAVNVKDAAIAVAILAGLYLGYRVVKGVGAAGDAAGNAISSVVEGAKGAAEAVGDAIGGAWDWATGWMESDPTETVLTADQVKRIEYAAANPYNLNAGLWLSGDPTLTQTGKNTLSTSGSVLDGSSLGGSWNDKKDGR